MSFFKRLFQKEKPKEIPAMPEKIRIDCCLNCKKRLKRAVFCNYTPSACE